MGKTVREQVESHIQELDVLLSKCHEEMSPARTGLMKAKSSALIALAQLGEKPEAVRTPPKRREPVPPEPRCVPF